MGPSFPSRAALSVALIVLVACGAADSSSPADTSGGNGSNVVASVVVTPSTTAITARQQTTLTAAATNAAGAAIAGAVAWSSSDTLVATVSSGGVVTGISAGQTIITATENGKSASATITVNRGSLSIRGVWAMFEDFGAQSGWYNGDVLKKFDSVDVATGLTVGAEIAQQMDLMRGMGINAFSFQIAGTDSSVVTPITPPTCYVPPLAGAQWPHPRAVELTNLVKLLDLAQQKGMRVLLNLSHTHYEETPDTNAVTWLTALINDVKTHPALELVTFMGDVHVNNFGTPTCGLPSEPPLWLGPATVVYVNMKAQMSLARSLGLDARKISVEAIVGGTADLYAGSTLPNHPYPPIQVLKQLFDELSWPDNQRTYALSYYDRLKCVNAPAGCVEVGDSVWADATMRFVSTTIGPASGARAIAIEWGTLLNAGATPDHGIPNITNVMRKYGMDGGAYWIWVQTDNNYEASLPLNDAVLKRGATILYTSYKDLLAKAYTAP